MSLAESLVLEAETAVRCKVCNWLAETSPDNVEAFSAYVATKGNLNILVRALAREDFKVDRSTIRRHVEQAHVVE